MFRSLCTAVISGLRRAEMLKIFCLVNLISPVDEIYNILIYTPQNSQNSCVVQYATDLLAKQNAICWYSNSSQFYIRKMPCSNGYVHQSASIQNNLLKFPKYLT